MAFNIVPKDKNLTSSTILPLARPSDRVAAKKGELDVGLGQCAAEMVAAQIFNANEDKTIPVVYGCVTSGKLWQFIKLENKELTLDLNEYQVTPVERILGILRWMVSDNQT